jgi:hypothetical protein
LKVLKNVQGYRDYRKSGSFGESLKLLAQPNKFEFQNGRPDGEFVIHFTSYTVFFDFHLFVFLKQVKGYAYAVLFAAIFAFFAAGVPLKVNELLPEI